MCVMEISLQQRKQKVKMNEDQQLQQQHQHQQQQKGLLLKRKDYLGVDEEAGSHPNRTYYYKKYSDLDNVIITCTKSLELDPCNHKALLLRGNTLLKLQQYQDAAQDFSQLIELDPSMIESFYGRGVAYSKLGDHELAIRDLTHVIQKNSDHVNALFARAACYNTIGQFSAAIEDYNIALLKDQSQNLSRTNPSPEKIRRSSFGGSISSRIDDGPPSSPPEHTRSRTPISTTSSSSPKQTKVQSRPSGSSHSAHIDHSRKSPLTHPAHPPHPQSQPPLPQPHLPQHHQPQPQPSIMNSQRSSTNSISADEYHRKGFEYRKQGNFTQAVEEYSRAIELDPNHFKAYFNRAFAYDKLNEYTRAVADYTVALSLDRMNSYAYYNRGITYDKLGDHQHACEDFQQALSLQSQNIDFMYNLALSYKKLNNLTEAIKYFKKCLEIDSNHLKSLQSLGNCLERMDRNDQALACYERVLEISPQNISTLISKAHLLHQIGGLENYQISIRLYSSILDLLYPDGAPSHPGIQTLATEKRREEAISIIYSRAHVYEDLNDLKSSIRDLTLAIELATQGKHSSKAIRADMLRDGLNPIPLSVLYSTRGVYYKSMEKYQQAIDDFNYFFSCCSKIQQPQQRNGNGNGNGQSTSNGSGSGNGHGNEIGEEEERDIPSLASVYNHRGYCYRKLDQYSQAIADYTEAISLLPSSIKGYNNRAYCYAKISDYHKAIQDYTSVLVIDELNAHAYHNRGISYDKLGVFDKAIEDFSKVIELDASSHSFNNGSHPITSMQFSGQSLPPPPPPSQSISNSNSTHSGRSTPGMFTPIRSNENNLSNDSNTTTSRPHQISQVVSQNRSRTPTNTLKNERKVISNQGNYLTNRGSGKSPTPSTRPLSSPSPSSTSLQDSIRAKMSPAPRSKEDNSTRTNFISAVDSKVQDQIASIQDASHRLASFQLQKNKPSLNLSTTTTSQPTHPAQHTRIKSDSQSQSQQSRIHSSSSTSMNPSQSTYLDGNSRSLHSHQSHSSLHPSSRFSPSLSSSPSSPTPVSFPSSSFSTSRSTQQSSRLRHGGKSDRL